MNSVYLDSPNNSTIFTLCCRVAINDDQAVCPRCREEVYPGTDATNHQRSAARWNRAYGPFRQPRSSQEKA